MEFSWSPAIPEVLQPNISANIFAEVIGIQVGTIYIIFQMDWKRAPPYIIVRDQVQGLYAI
jgi:hypothetical protein